MLHQELTRRILVLFFDVYNELGRGFLESVYVESLRLALEASGIQAEREVPIKVLFRGAVAGRFSADLVVERAIVVEIKVARTITAAHDAQLLHYLRATEMEVGLLLNFGPNPEFKRLVYSNDRKRSLRPEKPASTREDPR